MFFPGTEKTFCKKQGNSVFCMDICTHFAQTIGKINTNNVCILTHSSEQAYKLASWQADKLVSCFAC